MRKWFIRILVCMMVLSVVNLSNGQTSYANNSIYDTVSNGFNTVSITKYKGSSSTVEIPNTIGGKTVTAIGDKAFQYHPVEAVVIPNSVTIIGNLHLNERFSQI